MPKSAFIFAILLPISNIAFAVKSQCIQGVDWLPFCGFPDAPSLRCVLVPGSTWATNFCSPETVGCAELGGCFGDVPPGYWYPFIENNQGYKCRCGCVAADITSFDTSEGVVSGRTIIARKGDSDFEVASLDDIDSPWLTTPKQINEVMYSTSKGLSIQIFTEDGASVVASPGHPILVANEEGTPTMMKKASDLKTGEFVLTSSGEADKVVRVENIDYKKDLMNFNVVSSKSIEHIVPMNGILLGDYAWQERLNSRDSRVLLRAEVGRELQRKE